MEAVRVGIIGLGGVGTWGHLRGYEEIPDKAKLVALCDTNPDFMNLPSKIHGATTYSDYNDLISDPNVDIVDICLPHYLHGKIALAAVRAGQKHDLRKTLHDYS